MLSPTCGRVVAQTSTRYHAVSDLLSRGCTDKGTIPCCLRLVVAWLYRQRHDTMLSRLVVAWLYRQRHDTMLSPTCGRVVVQTRARYHASPTCGCVVVQTTARCHATSDLWSRGCTDNGTIQCRLRLVVAWLYRQRHDTMPSPTCGRVVLQTTVRYHTVSNLWSRGCTDNGTIPCRLQLVAAWLYRQRHDTIPSPTCGRVVVQTTARYHTVSNLWSRGCTDNGTIPCRLQLVVAWLYRQRHDTMPSSTCGRVVVQTTARYHAVSNLWSRGCTDNGTIPCRLQLVAAWLYRQRHDTMQPPTCGARDENMKPQWLQKGTVVKTKTGYQFGCVSAFLLNRKRYHYPCISLIVPAKTSCLSSFIFKVILPPTTP